MNTVEKYRWILKHPKISDRYINLPVINVEPRMINPLTNITEHDSSKNTKMILTCEVDIYDKDRGMVLDYDLEVSGNDYTDLINNLTTIIIKKYGSYYE